MFTHNRTCLLFKAVAGVLNIKNTTGTSLVRTALVRQQHATLRNLECLMGLWAFKKGLCKKQIYFYDWASKMGSEKLVENSIQNS